jgi:hypothetical protein
MMSKRWGSKRVHSHWRTTAVGWRGKRYDLASLDANKVGSFSSLLGYLDVNVMGAVLRVGGHVRYGRTNERVKEIL